MNQPMLFHTAIPVLLGEPRTAGRLAAMLYSRHSVVSHWFGRGWHIRLSIYAKRHPLSLTFDSIHDAVMIRLLLSFAEEQRYPTGIPCLIPCSADAEAFLLRVAPALEEQFVILERPDKGCDPLYGLVRCP